MDVVGVAVDIVVVPTEDVGNSEKMTVWQGGISWCCQHAIAAAFVVVVAVVVAFVVVSLFVVFLVSVVDFVTVKFIFILFLFRIYGCFCGLSNVTVNVVVVVVVFVVVVVVVVYKNQLSKIQTL